MTFKQIRNRHRKEFTDQVEIYNDSGEVTAKQRVKKANYITVSQWIRENSKIAKNGATSTKVLKVIG